jgi:hypothetical protein
VATRAAACQHESGEWYGELARKNAHLAFVRSALRQRYSVRGAVSAARPAGCRPTEARSRCRRLPG